VGSFSFALGKGALLVGNPVKSVIERWPMLGSGALLHRLQRMFHPGKMLMIPSLRVGMIEAASMCSSAGSSEKPIELAIRPTLALLTWFIGAGAQ
jgi:hypothetical protein